MAKNYFRNIPDFEYVNRTKDGQFISNYTQVKNFFKKAKLRDDLFQDLTVFEKYSVKGDDRPDNVAFEIYGDANLDWVVLLSNNIINVFDDLEEMMQYKEGSTQYVSESLKRADNIRLFE